MVTPIYVGGMLYVPNGFGLAEAVDPKTGATLWTQKPLIEGPEGLPSLMISKGVAHWGRGDDARILHVRQQHLFALNPKTGLAVASFGEGGAVDLSTDEFRYKWNGVPVVAGDVVARLVDARAGLRRLQGRTTRRRARVRRAHGQGALVVEPVPRAGDPATSTWQGEGWRYTGAGRRFGRRSAPTTSSAWSTCRRRASRTTCTAGTGLGNNLYGSSIVALNARTGERVWHFQTVHHDLFDYDLPAAPVLIDITVGGRPIKALAQVTKHGFLFVLDRATGAPVWPIEERPAPKSTVPGEVTAPTQPHPDEAAAVRAARAHRNDLIDFTPELRAEALEIAKRYVIGHSSRRHR